MTADIRPFPAPLPATPVERSPADATAHFVAIGLNLAAIAEQLARLEEERWRRGVPQAVREAMGAHLRAAREALKHVETFATRGEKL